MVEDLIVPVGLPVVILVCASVILCVLSMVWLTFFGVTRYKAPQHYTLDQPWDHDPILFSATGVPNMALPAHATESDTEGGAAHGKW
ncbi:hypothetical protein HUN08_06895 [Gordonia sp. X0973]|uniref:aa3-type cytochrome oxidase subunit CtaJ n=1 Tax=Gordonia sp. X0973 TaxID=2742602 RepID=UPI000F535647|nr:hypothetical protein [Gordonia sp. X0973]QKT06945.1 hypothetical protein HUN08_06895 [Gordonia sp. X0973]